jgi:FMN-dependent NADH-azoreductase
MTTLLRIDASARTTGSQSRALADAFEAAWRQRHPGQPVIARDLAAQPVAHISETTIAGFFTADEALTDAMRAATATSDVLLDEFNGADTVLIATPMYNFSLPSSLKAWIDQIVRINRTFAYDGTAFTGLAKTRRVVVLCAFGASGYKEALAAADFVTPYLKFLFGFMGVRDVSIVAMEGTTGDQASVARSLAVARDHALTLAAAA